MGHRLRNGLSGLTFGLGFIVCAFGCSPTFAIGIPDGGPNIGQLRLITHLPRELPPGVSDLAYDGEKVWAAIYQGKGRYATLDPLTLRWKVSDVEEQHRAIAEVAGSFESPGAIAFVESKLWVAGSYGDSFGSIETRDWKVTRVFKGRHRDDRASQSYAGMAYDGRYLWMAWHWFKYKLPASQTQLLLRVDPETGKVISEYPAPAGTSNDGTHALTWDGTRLWHMKDSRLSSVDPSTGKVTAQYSLGQIKRASGLAWDGKALWIAEFNGGVWHLPFAGRGVPSPTISGVPAEITGQWQGEFHQYSYAINSKYPMGMNVESTEADQFSGTLQWPTLRNSITRFRGYLQKDSLTWTETELIQGSNIVLHGQYVAQLVGPNTMSGKWLMPGTGNEGGSFVLTRAVPTPPTGTERLAKATALNDGIERRLRLLASAPPPSPITTVVRLTAPEELTNRAEELYYSSLDYRLLGAKALGAARTFLNAGDIATAEGYVERADRYVKLSDSLMRGAIDVANSTMDVAKALVYYESSLTALGFVVPVVPPQYRLLASTVYNVSELVADYFKDVATRTPQTASEQLIGKVFVKVLLEATGSGRFIEYTWSHGLGRSSVYPALQNLVGSSEFREQLLKTFMGVVGTVGEKEARAIVEKWLSEKVGTRLGLP